MSSGILDSSILIDCLRGRAAAVAFVAGQSAPTTRVMVAAELYAGARDKAEQQQIESFLAAFSLLSPTESDALAALSLYKQHHLSHGVDWPDCQIAATALRLGLAVYTQNSETFCGIRWAERQPGVLNRRRVMAIEHLHFSTVVILQP